MATQPYEQHRHHPVAGPFSGGDVVDEHRAVHGTAATLSVPPRGRAAVAAAAAASGRHVRQRHDLLLP